jgi:hypothetical protein
MAEDPRVGHRQRLRERFLEGEPESRSDEALLELLLTYAVGRIDVRLLAQELIRIFGSLSGVLSASEEDLDAVKGIGQSSIVLLKAVDYLRQNPDGPTELSSIVQEVSREAVTDQPRLFEIPASQGVPDQPMKSDKSPISPNTSETKTRKFQVSNGYLLEFDQLARILHFLLEHRDAKKISRKVLEEDTGLADRQVESLVSMGTAMGLIVPRVQILTPVGLLVAEHDIFIESTASLEWCHYVGAGSFRNLIWFEVFNRLLTEGTPMTEAQWTQKLRDALKGQYTERTIGKGLHEEIRFILDAYLERNLSKLEILHVSHDERLYRQRYTRFAPLVLCAMVYNYCATREISLFQLGQVATAPGSPAVVFGLDETTFREQIEELHERGWLRYETTFNLDQVRTKPGLSALELLTAHFEEREPQLIDR